MIRYEIETRTEVAANSEENALVTVQVITILVTWEPPDHRSWGGFVLSEELLN